MIAVRYRPFFRFFESIHLFAEKLFEKETSYEKSSMN